MLKSFTSFLNAILNDDYDDDLDLDEVYMQDVFDDQEDMFGDQAGEIRFSGFTHVEPIADLQQGPTCSHEAIENLVQLAVPGLPNSVSDSLVELSHGEALDPGYWQGILQQVGVPSQWYVFDHNPLISALSHHHGVAVIGDAHYLDPAAYPTGSLHAVVLTDVWKDAYGNVIGYKGIDSNFPGQEMHWPLQAVQQASDHGMSWARKVLITSVPLAWPHKTP